MAIKDLPKSVAISIVKGYQYFLSPFVGQHCRFFPSCSSYAIEAIERHGVLRGSLLAMRRLGRCHPLIEGGVDLVPEFTKDTSDRNRAMNDFAPRG